MKNLGTESRRMRFLRTIVLLVATPTFVSGVTPLAVAHQVFRLQLREPRGRTQLCQLHPPLAGLAVEVEIHRIFGADAIPFVSEKEVQRILRAIAADGVDGLVHHAEAEFGPRHGMSRGI